MRYHLDFQKPKEIESIFNPAPRKKFIIFFGKKRIGYHLDHDSSYEILRIHSTTNNFFKKDHIVDLIQAKLTIANPNIKITRSGFLNYPEDKIKDDIKIAVTTAKRMITKINNWIIDYDKKQEKLLIPFYENPNYINANTKLKAYKEQLKNLVSTHNLNKDNIKNYL